MASISPDLQLSRDPVADETPLMKQYRDLKSQAKDAFLFFRMGDFYELFGQDAIEASQILDITLTSRDKNKANPTPMCGFPHHSAQGYIQKLIQAGKKVAIGEQTEDPATVKGKSIVKREIIRTFTPGIQFELDGTPSRFLAALFRYTQKGKPGDFVVLALIDASTGETLVSPPAPSALGLTYLHLRPIGHLQILDLTHQAPEQFYSAVKVALPGALVETLSQNAMTLLEAERVLKSQFAAGSTDLLIPDGLAGQTSQNDLKDSSKIALALCVQTICKSQKTENLKHLKTPQSLISHDRLKLSANTIVHLDLLPDTKEQSGISLFETIQKTKSALGARELKRWLLAPLLCVNEITHRQQAVRELTELAQNRHSKFEALSKILSQLYDIERIMGRVHTGLANPRDTLGLGQSLNTLSGLIPLLQDTQSELLKNLSQNLVRLSALLNPLLSKILNSQKEEAPLISRDGGIFKLGTDPELDRLITLNADGQSWLLKYEAQERERSGIGSLKVRYNRVFGYYIEITTTHLKNVPTNYQRKQTTVGGERFFTDELAKFEDEIIHGLTRQKALEQTLFNELILSISEQSQPVIEAAQSLGELDALLSLSWLGAEPGWHFPEIGEGLDLIIQAGRHPVVDALFKGSFVPNTIEFSESQCRTLLITGPNMGGKSTLMRQVALIVILGQMGAPVPAQSAAWGVVSSIHTRIGAHDAIARGQSTFMVEMSELARILTDANERSLIILDEIGRGTSTYDGMSVAMATLEWVTQQIKSRTLFATHYHELTELAKVLPRLKNAHMAVAKEGSLRFLYELRDGPTNESYGIHVAKLAGLPNLVIERAWKILESLEKGELRAGGLDSSLQLNLFEAPLSSRDGTLLQSPIEIAPIPSPFPVDPVLDVLRVNLLGLDLNNLKPIEALNWLDEMQHQLSQSAHSSSPKSQ